MPFLERYSRPRGFGKSDEDPYVSIVPTGAAVRYARGLYNLLSGRSVDLETFMHFRSVSVAVVVTTDHSAYEAVAEYRQTKRQIIIPTTVETFVVEKT